MLAGTWFLGDLAGVPIDVRTAVSIIWLTIYCFHSGRRIIQKWGLMDVLIGAMLAWHIIVDSYHSGFDIGLPARAYGEWILPFAAGRYAIIFRESIVKLSPWFVAIGSILCIGGLVEFWFGINPWQLVFVEIDDLVKQYSGSRWIGRERAQGPTRNPIFLAAILMMLVPWYLAWISDFRERNQDTTQQLWVVPALLLGLLSLGILATMTRGAIVALGLSFVFYLGTRNRYMAILASTCVLIVGGLVFVNFDSIASWLHRTTVATDKSQVVEVDGKAERYTGTHNRLWVFRVYAPLATQGGVFGYGSDRTDTFPPDIPGLPKDERSRRILRFVDNSLILLALRFGWIGGILFTLLFVAGTVQCLLLRETAETFFGPSGRIFIIAQACIFVGIAFQTVLVFWSYDYAFWVIFHLGVLAGLQSLRKLVLSGQID